MGQNASRCLFTSAPARLLFNRRLVLAGLGLVLLGRPEAGVAQVAPNVPAPAPPVAAAAGAAPEATPTAASPRFLLKGGLQLTHLFYLPDHLGWQLIFPTSLGFEYRLNPRFSLLARAEADVAAGRAPRGRRGGNLAPAPGAALGLGARYYFNQSRALCAGAPAECWGSYLALETSTDLSAAGRLRGGARSRRRGAASLTRFTPSVFVLVGTQHQGPGRHMLYDLSAGLGIEAPPSYATDATISRPWEMASQVNLRVYFVNQTRAKRK